MMILPSKYVLNLTTSHHLHPGSPAGLFHRYLSGWLELLQWPGLCAFLLVPLQSVLHTAAKVRFEQ